MPRRFSHSSFGELRDLVFGRSKPMAPVFARLEELAIRPALLELGTVRADGARTSDDLLSEIVPTGRGLELSWSARDADEHAVAQPAVRPSGVGRRWQSRG